MFSLSPQPPVPTLTDLAPALAIMAMITDAEATKARLDQLAAASAEARSAIDQAVQDQRALVAARAAHDEAITQERAAHDAALAKERSDFLSDCGTRERALNECAAKIGALEEKAKADADAAASLKANLEQKIARMQQLAA